MIGSSDLARCLWCAGPLPPPGRTPSGRLKAQPQYCSAECRREGKTATQRRNSGHKINAQERAVFADAKFGREMLKGWR